MNAFFFLFLPTTCVYLDLVQHGPGLLQGHRLSGPMHVGVSRHLLQPATQLVRHLLVLLPLARQAVDDASALLGPPHHALPLVAQQGQLQAEVVPGDGEMWAAAKVRVCSFWSVAIAGDRKRTWGSYSINAETSATYQIQGLLHKGSNLPCGEKKS